MRRNRLWTSDLPPRVGRAWRLAEYAAKKKDYGAAQRHLRTVLRAHRSLRDLPATIVKRKLKRVTRLYQKRLSKLSPTARTSVTKTLIASQQALFNGKVDDANRKLNKVLHQLH